MRIEDFYDVPSATALLAGGPHAGWRVSGPDGCEEWAGYFWTGLVLDDGTRVFAAGPAANAEASR